jgi:hypothetical protein
MQEGSYNAQMLLFTKHAIETHSSEIYGDGFRNVHKVFEALQHGGRSQATVVSEILTHIRQHKVLPAVA